MLKLDDWNDVYPTAESSSLWVRDYCRIRQCRTQVECDYNLETITEGLLNVEGIKRFAIIQIWCHCRTLYGARKTHKDTDNFLSSR
jgi:hypothetical protein